MGICYFQKGAALSEAMAGTRVLVAVLRIMEITEPTCPIISLSFEMKKKKKKKKTSSPHLREIQDKHYGFLTGSHTSHYIWYVTSVSAVGGYTSGWLETAVCWRMGCLWSAQREERAGAPGFLWWGWQGQTYSHMSASNITSGSGSS